jgi:hypothetical protein
VKVAYAGVWILCRTRRRRLGEIARDAEVEAAMGKGADFLLLHISAGLWKSKQAKKNQKDDGRGFRVEKPSGGGGGRVRSLRAKEYAGELLFRPLRRLRAGSSGLVLRQLSPDGQRRELHSCAASRLKTGVWFH